MSDDTHEPEVIDITKYRSKKKEAFESNDSLRFLRLQNEKSKIQARLNFLYSIANFLLVYNLFLTIALFYFLVIKS